MYLHICKTIFQHNLSTASLTKLATQETQLMISNHNWTLFTTIMSLCYILSSFFLSNSFTKGVLAHFIFDNKLNKDVFLFKQIPCGPLCFFFRNFSIMNIWHFFFSGFCLCLWLSKFLFKSFYHIRSTTSWWKLQQMILDSRSFSSISLACVLTGKLDVFSLSSLISQFIYIQFFIHINFTSIWVTLVVWL